VGWSRQSRGDGRRREKKSGGALSKGDGCYGKRELGNLRRNSLVTEKGRSRGKISDYARILLMNLRGMGQEIAGGQKRSIQRRRPILQAQRRGNQKGGELGKEQQTLLRVSQTKGE